MRVILIWVMIIYLDYAFIELIKFIKRDKNNIINLSFIIVCIALVRFPLYLQLSFRKFIL